MIETYDTVLDAVNGLKKQDYTLDFNINNNSLVCDQTKASLSPEDFQIDKFFRFEGESNPDDEAIVYAISSTKHNMKGVLVNGYGVSADSDSDKVIEKLSTRDASVD